ncbi:MAG: HNH endonuclease [Sphingopyxis sp.]|uniref:HNH endonuclease n=1 Tax=Bosea sp. (in: a-proteobacteria) TaxID=1871050 RepID=UPI001A20F10E|nr:HNH endonuclease [Bosea sp. (in: a-proteobacteria)]MBJ7441481.1 HNH endonuclease [Sphingopyxis sp.]|tara:strand:- start:944 stop:2842 length:1899 start_codon:yes stop_codon:yes gene_type:complete
MDHGILAEHFTLLDALDGVARASGDPAQDRDYETLVEAHEATARWARAVQDRLFPKGFVRKLSRPTDMAQKFKPYTWVRIYPRKGAPKELAYTVGIDASGEFCVKIDTVQINGTETRRRYDELRHHDHHLSPFAAIILAETGLAMSFEKLVDWSCDQIGTFEPGYDALAQELGLIAPQMRLVTESEISRDAFVHWHGALGAGPADGAMRNITGQNVWLQARDSQAGMDVKLGLDANGGEWSVEINAPPVAGDHNRLSGIARDPSGGLHLLRQGWLRGRRPAPDIREQEFAEKAGLTAIPVVATGKAAARRWFLVASLDDPLERIRRTTARFVELCERTRTGKTVGGSDDKIAFVTDFEQLFANVATLDAVRTDPVSSDYGAYLSLIKRGTCFLPYATPDGIAFAPSRFIGYVGNSFARHSANEARDGRLTNGAINTVLGYAPVLELALEEQYQQFCARLGFAPSKTGTFGVARKYWLTADMLDRLDLLAEQKVVEDPTLTATQKEQLIQARIGQGEFRHALLSHWRSRCCVTDCAIRPVLRASHIKPWRVSSNRERLDRFNGLLLVANVDALFDRFLISFSDMGEMLIGPDIDQEDLIVLGCDPARRIAMSAGHSPYLEWHRAEFRARGGKG